MFELQLSFIHRDRKIYDSFIKHMHSYKNFIRIISFSGVRVSMTNTAMQKKVCLE